MNFNKSMADYLMNNIKQVAIFNGKRCKIAVFNLIKRAEKN